MSDPSSRASSSLLGRKGASQPSCSDMEGTRYSDQHVVFRHEFTLGSSGGVYPPGDYIIEVAETRHLAGGHTAHVHRSTLLIVPTSSGTRAIPIGIRELEVAMKHDVERQAAETSGDNCSLGSAAIDPAEAVRSQLERYGIERIPADVFIWGGYRYSNASDAIAAAKRSER